MMNNSLVLNSWYAWALVGTMVAAFVGFFLSAQAGFWLLLFIVVGWWTWEHSESGFLFLLVILPILPMLKITQTIGTVTLIKDVIILGLFLKLFLIPVMTKKLVYRRNILFLPVVALVAWTAVETWRADSLILGVLRARDIVLYILLYFGVLYLPHSRRIMKERLMWFSASAVVVLMLAVYQWWFAGDSTVLRFDPVREVWIPRLSSILAHPSIFGQYLVGLATLWTSVTLIIRTWRWRVGFGLAAAFTLPFIFLTYSRAVWIGLVVALVAIGVVMLYRQAKQLVSGKALWRLGGGGVVIGLVVIFILIRLTPVGIYVRSAIDPTYGSNEERIEFAARLIAPMTNREALVGKGLGDVLAQNFRDVDLATFDIAAGSARAVQLTKNRTLVDNQFLKTFVEMGLVGLLIYLWLYLVFAKHSFILATQFPISNFQFPVAVGLWGVGFIVAFVVQGLFIDIWDIWPTNALFWIVAALVSMSLGPMAGEERSKG